MKWDGILGAAIIFIILFIACADNGSNTEVDDSSQCLGSLEDQMSNLLSEIETDTDFTLYLETEAGDTYTFSRGASTLLTSYESASTSKWVAAAVILRLVDRGLLSLDDHPQDYIADWRIEASDPLYGITLSHLLSFTSGLVTEPLCINLPGYDFEDCVGQIAIRNATNGKIPGAEFDYGSAHLQVAGLMAVKAAGVSNWQEVFEAFKTETGLFAHGAFDLPSGSNPRLAGGMHWQADEYAAFIREFQFGSLLSQEMKTQILSDQVAGLDFGNHPPSQGIGQEWHYGYGIWLQCPSTEFDCDTIDYYSSPGAYGAYPFMNTRHRFFGILARQGALGSYVGGYTVYTTVADLAEQWAAADCP